MFNLFAAIPLLLSILATFAPQFTVAAPTSRSLVKRSDFSQSSGPNFRFTGGLADVVNSAQYLPYESQGAGKIDFVQVVGYGDSQEDNAWSTVYDTIHDYDSPAMMDQNMLVGGVNLYLTFTRVDVAKFKAENKFWGFRLFYITYPASVVGEDGVNNIDSPKWPIEWWGN